MNDRLPQPADDTPERRELAAKWDEARRLRERVVEKELEKSTLETGLEQFHTAYLHRLGDLYLRLDQLEAELLEQEARRQPADDDLDLRARAARAKAERTADDVAAAREKPERPPFQPTEEIRALFREAARILHPDLAGDEAEARHRHDFMVRLNGAYARGDADGIHELLVAWESNLAPSDDEVEVGRALVRALRVIDSLRRTIERLDAEIRTLLTGDLACLRDRIEAARARGDHPIAQLEKDLTAQIDLLAARLHPARSREEPGKNN